MTTPTFYKSFTATGAIAPFRIVAFTVTDLKVAQAAAATDKLAGVTDSLGATAAGQTVEVLQGGWGEVQLGGTVAAGDPLTSDANGKAVKATVAAATVKSVIGIAQKAGVANDIVPYLAAPSVIAAA